LWSITKPNLIDRPGVCSSTDGTKNVVLTPGQGPSDCVSLVGTGALFTPGFKEVFLGNSPKPRVSVGIGVNWISPFGPLRLDLAKALVLQRGDDPKLFTFNVGTAF
jgi:outer membrane protein insertion porin family